MKIKRYQQGFTIVELLIATASFSLILLLLTSMIIRVGQSFQKGIIMSKTQETARAIISDITHSIQFSSAGVSSGANYYCAGSQRYIYKLGSQVAEGTPVGTQVRHALLTDTPAACSGGSPLSSQRELLPAHMRLAKLSITPNGTTGPYTVTVRIVYGDDDLLTNPAASDARCRGLTSGTQFCATSELTTIVSKRL